MRQPKIAVVYVAGLASLVGLLACGGKDVMEQLPAAPADIASVPTPTPAPVSSSPNIPSVPEPVGSVSCDLGAGSHEAQCSLTRSKLINPVEAAIDALVDQKPELFNQTIELVVGTRQYVILDTQAFLAGVLYFLRQDGYCADLDYTTLENIVVKNETKFSEEFSIIVRTGGKTYIRRMNTGLTGIQGSYWNTCTPSAFPVEPEPDAPPPGSGCGKPYPPGITRFGAKVHVKNPTDDLDSIMLDSTPLVGPRPDFCESIGYTDGRFFCPVRMEGHPERRACENWIVGVAPDTNRPGATWSRNAKWGSAEWEKHSGVFCTTREETACRHNPNNPYSLYVYPGGQGEYYACNAEGSICSGAVDVVF